MKVIFYGLLIALLIAGCGQGRQTKVDVDEHNGANRLVVANSSALEMLIGLGAAENIVGINDMRMQSYIYKNQKWTSIGNWQSPNIEAIVDLKANVAVTYRNSPAPAVGFEDKLKPFNISVERLNCYRISEFHSDLSRLAFLVGKENMADSMIYDFDKIADMVKNAISDIDVKKKVYVEFGTDFVAYGAGTGADEILDIVNATNIASELEISYPRISTEWLLKENPDIIIKVITADTITVEMYEQLVNRPGWDKLDAVKNKQIYLLSTEICSGPRAMIGSLYIGKWCYPERFASIDPDSVLAYWMKKYYGVSSDNFIFTLKK